MKHLLSLILFVISLPSLAQVSVELNSSEVSVDTDQAVIVRTSRTPEKVKIKMQVPKDKETCERYDSRRVMRTSSLECGTDIAYRQVPYGSVCVRLDRESGVCRRYQTEYRMETYDIPRTCMVEETYCSQHGTVTVRELETLTVKFKKAAVLGGSETESFLVKADQKRYDGDSVRFNITAQQTIGTYKIERKKVLGGIFGREDDSYVIEGK